MAMSPNELNSRFKILFLGDEGAGKTAIINRFTNNEFSGDYSPTVGMDFKSNTLFLGGRMTKLKIWDASGHMKFRSLIPQYIRDSDVIVLVYDCTSRETFEAIDTWMKTIEDARSLSEILLVLVATKVDKDSERQISEKEGKDYSRKNNTLYLESSAKSGEKCKELFHTIAKHLAPEDVADQKESTDLIKELDEMDDDDYFGGESEKSLCCKLCCCLGIFCPCLSFLCDDDAQPTKRRNGHSAIVDSEVGESAGNFRNTDDTDGEFKGVFTIDPEDELEDLEMEDDFE